MGIPLLNDHGLPPTGARVYVKSRHGIGTVAVHENGKIWVNMDRGRGMDKGEGHIVKCKGGDDLIVIGPPELLGHCAVDTCPICEEPIRIRKHEQ